MRKTVCIVLLALLGLFELRAQVMGVEMEVGAEVRTSKYTYVNGLLGAIDGKQYVIRSKGSLLNMVHTSPTVEVLDGNMNLVRSEELDMEENGKELSLFYPFILNNKIWILSTFVNQSKKEYYLFAQTLDPKNLTRNKDIRAVSSLPFQNRYASGTYDVDFSRDSSHVMIIGLNRGKKDDPEVVKLNMFDKDMNQVWEVEDVLDFEDRLFHVKDFVVGNDGKGYVLGRRYFNKTKTRVKGKPNYEYIVLEYGPGSAEPKEHVIQLQDLYITDLKMEVNKDGSIILAGFYSEKSTFQQNGTFFQRLDGKTWKTVEENYSAFRAGFLEDFLSRKQESRLSDNETVHLYEFDLDDLILRGDGGVVMVAEQFYVRVVTSTSSTANGGMTTTTTTYYNYNSIMVASISPEGDIEWVSAVPKRQVSTNDSGYYSSYCMMIRPDYLYFIYNEDDRNLEGRGVVRNFNVRDKHGCMAIARVDDEGNVEIQKLLDNEQVEGISQPKSCRQISRSEMMLYFIRKKDMQYGKLVFP